MNNCIPLSQLPEGKSGRVKNLSFNGIGRRRMLDLGLIIDTVVQALQEANKIIVEFI